MFEVVDQQIGDGVRGTGAVAGPFEVDAGNTVRQFKFAVTSEAVGEIDPAVRILLRCAGTFEVFVEKREVNVVTARPTDSRHFKRRQVIGVAIFAHKVHIDLHVQRRGTRLARMRGCARGCGGTRRRWGAGGRECGSLVLR